MSALKVVAYEDGAIAMRWREDLVGPSLTYEQMRSLLQRAYPGRALVSPLEQRPRDGRRWQLVTLWVTPDPSEPGRAGSALFEWLVELPPCSQS